MRAAPVIAPAGAEASAPATPTLAPGTCVSTAETSLPQVSVPWSSLGLIIESPDLPLNDSLVAKQVSGNDPEQIHLAIGASVEEMYVIWVSGNASFKKMPTASSGSKCTAGRDTAKLGFWV